MNQLIINADQGTQTIDPHIYGHFAEHLGRCIYEGFWVGENSDIPNTRGIRNDVVEALKNLNIPNLRWPGGCFADEYHWMDGIGPRETRKQMVNTHWGNVVENNHFGTHEFFDLCEMLGTQAYICGNVGSGSVQEMADWVEYITHPGGSKMAELRKSNGREEPWKLPFFGVGNESWGCGGNMLPEYYAHEYRRYQTYVRQYGEHKIYKIACGANAADFNWTDVLMKQAVGHMDGLSLHYYTLPGDWGKKGSATQFDEAEYHKTLAECLKMDELITRHGVIMDKYDPQKRVGMIVDEWGTWYDVEPGTNPGFLYQQNTQRDALVAGLNFHIFHNHADRVKMANIAQTVNVLQAMILTDGAQMILTPTYHVFEMFKVHQGATRVPTHLQSEIYANGDSEIPAISASASRDSEGRLNLSLCHTQPGQSATVEIEVRGLQAATATGRVLACDAIDARNTFEAPHAVAPRELTSDELQLDGQKLRVTLPGASVAIVTLEA